MGSTAHVVVVGDASLVDTAFARLDDLERRWTRFRPTSELSRLNKHPGQHVIVSAETLTLVQRSIAGWRTTGGLFDPTVLPALRAAGYDRDFASVAAHARTMQPADVGAAPGCAGIECDERVRAVTLPAGVELDAGGIGKGLAADIVSGELIAAGAHGALVNVGGDLRVRGEPPAGDAWDVAVEDAATQGVLIRLGLLDAAVATSSRLRRRWTTGAGVMHHLVDPSTGRPACGSYATVSTVAHEAWWAEVVAKAIIVGGHPVAEFANFDALVVAVDDDGLAVCDAALAAVPA
jgi:thiamine biosynthesis lipoprotein